jgi:hypothetical protein
MEIKRVKFAPVKPCTLKNEYKCLKDYYYFFYRLWACHIAYWPYNIKHGVINLWHWLPFIWGSRDWDQAFMWRMMLKKMRYMQVDCRTHVQEGAHHKALDRCVVLLDELLKRDQCDCSLLGKGCGVKRYMRCKQLQCDMLAEFGYLFARWSPSWWS